MSKPTEIQIHCFQICQEVLDFKTCNDLKSPSNYNIIETHITESLIDLIPEDKIKELVNKTTDIYDYIKNNI